MIFSIMQKNWIYLARYRHDWEEGVNPEPRQYPPFVPLHALPRGEQGRQDEAWKRRRKDANAGEIHRRAPDLHLGRHASWNSHSGKKLFYHTSPRSARFSARCCFAFYTGVEIWSLDSPMHHRSGPPLTVRTASSSSFRNGALRATFLMDSSQIIIVNISLVEFCVQFTAITSILFLCEFRPNCIYLWLLDFSQMHTYNFFPNYSELFKK